MCLADGMVEACLGIAAGELAAPVFLAVILIIQFAGPLVALGNQRFDPRIPLGGLVRRRHGIMGDDQPQIIPGALADDFFSFRSIESSFDELKTHLAERRVVLRSKRPELVEQEFYALLLVHAAVRHLMTEAAAQTGQAAQDLSFIHAVRVLHRRLPAAGAIPPSG
ncbi:hypothetical protein HMI48_06185 [Acidithiobacillus ferrooxidans]|jgi:hypothetical protein|nr:hypothetical protein [Acidithiobacillus ferrooxidans]MBU2807933.1 hypothetical protein [Acidithiobacillus ferrooxidans F221]MBU2826211.1 hypothetical protein [Acidithiobacillus ferrooxidans]